MPVVDGDKPDDISDNTATADVVVDASINLSVTQRTPPAPVAVGSRITYDLAVANGGPSDATGVVLSITSPAAVAGVVLDSAVVRPNPTSFFAAR